MVEGFSTKHQMDHVEPVNGEQHGFGKSWKDEGDNFHTSVERMSMIGLGGIVEYGGTQVHAGALGILEGLQSIGRLVLNHRKSVGAEQAVVLWEAKSQRCASIGMDARCDDSHSRQLGDFVVGSSGWHMLEVLDH